MPYEHCLYLLAEIERMIERGSEAWPPAQTSLIRFRLLQIAEKLTWSGPLPRQ